MLKKRMPPPPCRYSPLRNAQLTGSAASAQSVSAPRTHLPRWHRSRSPPCCSANARPRRPRPSTCCTATETPRPFHFRPCPPSCAPTKTKRQTQLPTLSAAPCTSVKQPLLAAQCRTGSPMPNWTPLLHRQPACCCGGDGGGSAAMWWQSPCKLLFEGTHCVGLGARPTWGDHVALGLL